MDTYHEKWAHMYEGHNLARAAKWRLVTWAEIRPGDVINFFDAGGRFCSRFVASRSPNTVIAASTSYGGLRVEPEVSIVFLPQKQARSGRGVGMPYFRYAERPVSASDGLVTVDLRRKKKRKFKPLTVKP